MAICLPGIASSAKRAPTSATRSDPLAITMNWMVVEHEEDDRADDVVAAHDERPERPDDLAGVGLEQDEPRRRDVEREPEERREKEERREGRDADGVGHVEDDEQDRDRSREVGRDEQVERPRRKRDDHQPDDEDDERREGDVGAAESRSSLSDVQRKEGRRGVTRGPAYR